MSYAPIACICGELSTFWQFENGYLDNNIVGIHCKVCGHKGPVAHEPCSQDEIRRRWNVHILEELQHRGIEHRPLDINGSKDKEV